MDSRNLSPNQIKDIVRRCLNKLYTDDEPLFRRNNGKGVCERCLVFRFAFYLQNELPDMFVDCDFNSSFEGYLDGHGNIWERQRSGKPISNPDGSVTKRFVDIIVHKRDFAYGTHSDFICFEIKKWNNKSASEQDKDYNNLRVLTFHYGYHLGLHVVLGRQRVSTKWAIFRKGQPILNSQSVFPNEARNQNQRN